MKRAIFNALNIQEEEGNKVILLVLQSVFLGSFYGTYDIGAHTLFLKTFAEDMIPKAYTLSGIIGILMTSLYSIFQSRIKFSKLAVGNLFVLAIMTLLLRAGFYFTEAHWLIFLIFMMMGPINIVAMVGFWGTAGRLFTLRQGKRLFGIVDTGQIIGIIIASYAIPLIPILLKIHLDTKNLILISGLSILSAFIVQFFISKNYNLDSGKDDKSKPEKQPEKAKERSITLKEFFGNRYISLMALFILLSMMVAFFVQFSFLVVINEKYPEEADLANYLATFTGTMMIFSLLIKTTVYSKLMKTYGLKLSLALSPILLAVFSILASLAGSFFGYDIATASNFMLFFLLISLSKLFNKALKDAIEVPSFKILYQSLSSAIRFDVQSRIDGTVNEFSAVFSGLVLTLLGLIGFFTIIFYSYVLVIILAVWTAVSFYLYINYKKSLQVSLKESKSGEKEDLLLSQNINLLIRQNIQSEETKNYVKTMYLARLIEPGLYYNLLYRLFSNSSVGIRKFAILQIKNRKVFSLLNEVKIHSEIEKDAELKKLFTNTYNELNSDLKTYSKESEIIKLGQSRITDDRILCAQIIGTLKISDHVPQLIVLLRDLEPEVRKAALLAAGKFKHPELIPAIIENLASPIYQRYASASIEEFGEEAVDHLEQAFYKTGLSDEVLMLITRIMGNIKGEKSIKYLLTKIKHNNIEIAKQAMISLRFCNYKASEFEVHILSQNIEELISIINWNMGAFVSLENRDESEELKNALKEEISENYELLFHMLSLAYDPQSIQLVRENLESGTSEGIGFAIELLDLFIAEELKPILFPIFEDTGYSEKIKILQDHFPIVLLNEKELVNAIINRDPNNISRWTKVCAIKLLYKIENYTVSNDLLAHLFNSDLLIRETAGIAIKTKNSKAFADTGKRILNFHRDHIEEAYLYENEERYKLMMVRNDFLKGLEQFSHVSGRNLTKLGDLLNFTIVEKTDNLFKGVSENNMEYFFLIKGKIKIESGKYKKIYEENAFINEIHTLLPPNEIKIEVIERSLMYKISKDDFDFLLFNNPEIAKILMNKISLGDEESLKAETVKL